MSFIFYAWVASIGYSLVVIVGKLTSKHSLNNPWLFNFLYNFSMLLWTIPVALSYHAGMPTHWEYIILTGLFYALSTMCFVLALYKLDVSTYSPLFNFRIAFSVILAAILIHEVLPFWKYCLIAVIFIFGLFTTVDESFHIKSFFQKPVAIALIGMVFTSLGGITTNLAIAHDAYWTVSLWAPVWSVFFLLATIPKFSKDIRKTSIKPLIFIFIMGSFDLIGTLASNKAFAENVGITSVIISLPISMFVALLFSIFAPKLLEKHTAKVYAIRFAAGIIMILAALKL